MRVALLIALTLATVLLNASLTFGEPIEVSKNIRVYRGPEGVLVVVAAVLPKSKNRAVVRVGGTDSPFDDVVFLASVEDLGSRGSTFKLTWHGRSWGVLTSRQSWWGGNTLQLHVPGQRAIPVGYSEKESAKVSILALKKGLKRDRAEVAKLAKFDRKAEESKQEKSLLLLSEKVNSKCGVLVSMNVEWSSIDDQTLQSKSISNYCGAPLQRLARMCKDSKIAALVRKTIENASCHFGSALRLRVESRSLAWQTNSKAMNQDAFVSANLRNILQ